MKRLKIARLKRGAIRSIGNDYYILLTNKGYFIGPKNELTASKLKRHIPFKTKVDALNCYQDALPKSKKKSKVKPKIKTFCPPCPPCPSKIKRKKKTDKKEEKSLLALAKKISGKKNPSQNYLDIAQEFSDNAFDIFSLDARDIKAGKSKIEYLPISFLQGFRDYRIDIPERVTKAKKRYQEKKPMYLPRIGDNLFEDGRHRVEAWRQLGHTSIWVVQDLPQPIIQDLSKMKLPDLYPQIKKIADEYTKKNPLTGGAVSIPTLFFQLKKDKKIKDITTLHKILLKLEKFHCLLFRMPERVYEKLEYPELSLYKSPNDKYYWVVIFDETLHCSKREEFL